MNHHSPSSDQTGRQQRKRGRKRLPERERQARRLIQNRVSAMKCRNKKKAQFYRLSEDIRQLKQQNQFLLAQINQLTNALASSNAGQVSLQAAVPINEEDKFSSVNIYEGNLSNSQQIMSLQPSQGDLNFSNVNSKNQEKNPISSMSPGMYPAPLSDRLLLQRYGINLEPLTSSPPNTGNFGVNPTNYINSVHWHSSQSDLAHPWNLEIGMNWNMSPFHSSVHPNVTGFIKCSHTAPNNSHPGP